MKNLIRWITMKENNSIYAVICPGPSLTKEQCNLVQSVLPDDQILAVNNAIELIPQAGHLVANDAEWYHEYNGWQYGAKKYSNQAWANRDDRVIGLERLRANKTRYAGNSGVFAMEVARLLGARQIVLVGADMHGTHFFGAHKNLRNTDAKRRSVHLQQYVLFYLIHSQKIRIVNATKGSAIRHIPYMPLDRFLGVKKT